MGPERVRGARHDGGDHGDAGDARRGTTRAAVARCVWAAAWAYLVWNLLTWTATAENLGIGAGIAVLVGLAFTPLGAVARPWWLADPRRWPGLVRFTVTEVWAIARKNVSLAGRILAPDRPLANGMVTTYTRARTDGEITVVALATSLVADNQFIDLDPERCRLQFHCVAVPEPGDTPAYRAINGPVEAPLMSMTRT